MTNSLFEKIETWRLHQHFKRVETILRSKDVSHLSLNSRIERTKYLNRLHEYAERGMFPRNHEKGLYSPCFIDRDGRECAVAHLVMYSDHNELADNIMSAANYAYVPEMDFDELDDWATQAGFTREELALIQPGYWLTFEGILQYATIFAWLMGSMMLALNITDTFRTKHRRDIAISGIVVAVILLLIGCFWLLEANGTYGLSTHPDVPQYRGNQALEAVPGLAFAAATSLFLAFVLGISSHLRLRSLSRNRRKKRR